MERFNINDIENLTGIRAHTLRIWEKRYNIIKPKRKISNHRYYDNDDLKHILKIAYLYNNGYKISRIASLGDAELYQLTDYIDTNKNTDQLLVNKLLQHSFEFDTDGFEESLNTAIEKLGFAKCIQRVVFPYFEKIGNLWMNNIAVPAQEHYTSNIIRNKIIFAVNELSPVIAETPATLLFTPCGEYHELPLLYYFYLFKKHGRKCFYLGADSTINDLQACVSARNIGVLYFHLITNFTDYDIDDYLNTLLNTFPSQHIVASGPFSAKATVKHPNCTILTSQEAALDFIKPGLSAML